MDFNISVNKFFFRDGTIKGAKKNAGIFQYVIPVKGRKQPEWSHANVNKYLEILHLHYNSILLINYM